MTTPAASQPPSDMDSILGIKNAAELNSTNHKAWWKSRTVQVVVVGAGFMPIGALLIASCYLAAAVVCSLTAVIALGCTAKYLYDRYTVPATYQCRVMPASNRVIPGNDPDPVVNAPVQKLPDPFNLQRFIDAQDNGRHGATHHQALTEMQNGKKETHWSWYELPIVAGFGKSEKARLFALNSLEEVRSYYANDTLKYRLLGIFQYINNHQGKCIKKIMGGVIDADKLKSCATLFYNTTGEEIFQVTLNQFFDGAYCKTATDKLAQWQQHG